MKYGNCWLYAVSRWAWHGGAVIVCWSPRNVCISHAMRSADVSSIECSTAGFARSVAALFREGGYLVVGWRSGRSAMARAGHTHSVAGVEVTEFIPRTPHRGFRGLIDAICFSGYVRTRRMKGPGETLSGRA